MVQRARSRNHRKNNAPKLTAARTEKFTSREIYHSCNKCVNSLPRSFTESYWSPWFYITFHYIWTLIFPRELFGVPRLRETWRRMQSFVILSCISSILVSIVKWHTKLPNYLTCKLIIIFETRFDCPSIITIKIKCWAAWSRLFTQFIDHDFLETHKLSEFPLTRQD